MARSNDQLKENFDVHLFALEQICPIQISKQGPGEALNYRTATLSIV